MKEGIEYMMLSVSMGSAWKLLIAEYGHKAISVLFLVHQMIYSEKGYYTEWNEDRALLLTLAGTNLTAEEIQEVIRGAIRRNVFDKSMYEEHGILTSEEVQKCAFFDFDRPDYFLKFCVLIQFQGITNQGYHVFLVQILNK